MGTMRPVTARRPSGQGRIGQVHREHGAGNGRLVEDESYCGGDDGQKNDEPGHAAVQKPSQLQGEQTQELHCTASREMR